MLPAIKITDHNSNGNWVEFYEVQSESRPAAGTPTGTLTGSLPGRYCQTTRVGKEAK